MFLFAKFETITSAINYLWKMFSYILVNQNIHLDIYTYFSKQNTLLVIRVKITRRKHFLV